MQIFTCTFLLLALLVSTENACNGADCALSDETVLLQISVATSVGSNKPKTSQGRMEGKIDPSGISSASPATEVSSHREAAGGQLPFGAMPVEPINKTTLQMPPEEVAPAAAPSKEEQAPFGTQVEPNITINEPAEQSPPAFGAEGWVTIVSVLVALFCGLPIVILLGFALVEGTLGPKTLPEPAEEPPPSESEASQDEAQKKPPRSNHPAQPRQEDKTERSTPEVTDSASTKAFEDAPTDKNKLEAGSIKARIDSSRKDRESLSPSGEDRIDTAARPNLSKEKGQYNEEEEGLVFKMVKYDYFVQGWIRLYVPPAVLTMVVLSAVFGLPLLVGGKWTLPTPTMVYVFTCYITFDCGLRLLLSFLKWRLLLYQGFSQDEVALLAGPDVVIPTADFRRRGGNWLYQMDSYGRKFPHILHWAGLSHCVAFACDSTWSRFQFSVMGATTDILLQLSCYSTRNFYLNLMVWLSVVRTNDGYARRMNNLYCSMSSVIGMGVVVPVCASVISESYGSSAGALLYIITIPCAWGDCLAEIVGVNGVWRFRVYGIGEVNNKSLEGMIAMFLGSVLPAMPYAWAVGGWPYLCIVGVLATIAETWSPRGTDNIFIPAFSALGVVISLQLSSGMQAVPA